MRIATLSSLLTYWVSTRSANTLFWESAILLFGACPRATEIMIEFSGCIVYHGDRGALNHDISLNRAGCNVRTNERQTDRKKETTSEIQK